MFRRRVLEAAINEVNEKSDISVSISSIERIGRKVVAVTLAAQRNDEFDINETNDEEIYQKLKSCGFSSKRSKQIINQHDKEYILANIAVVEEQYIAK